MCLTRARGDDSCRRLPSFGGPQKRSRYIVRREHLAEPAVVPLAGAEPDMPHSAHLPVAGLLVRPAAAAVAQRDPVVDATQPQLRPREIGPEPHGLGRDAAPVEVVPADEDPALRVARDPVDVEQAREADRLTPVGDGPHDRSVIVAVLLVPFLGGLVARVDHPAAPEAGRLRLDHPAAELLMVVERRRPELDVARADKAGPEHLMLRLGIRVATFETRDYLSASGPSGAYSRSVAPHRRSHSSRSICR